MAVSGDRKREREHLLRVAREAPKTLRQIVCRKRDRLVLLPPEQILWFQVEDGIVKAHTGAETFWVNYQLGELEAGLAGDVFFRARREVLVNVGRIKEIRPYFKSGFLLIMADAASTEIVVSERQARSFRQRIPGL
jgi:DNA-binding LytR/AlgR family response regulator